MHSLLILARRAPEYRSLVEAAAIPGLTIVSADKAGDARSHAAGCDLALGEPALFAEILPQMTRLRWLQSTWAGIEPLLDQALPRRYALTNACDVFGPQMCEYVFAYLLAHKRRILEQYALQKEARWHFAPPGSLHGKRIGLLGVGSIGSALARTAKHFGMRVSGYTRRSEACADVDDYFHDREALPSFARNLDYLVCMMPSTEKTRRIVDDRLLRALPPHAVLVNPGRGNSIDTDALVDALNQGRLAGAVLDVFDQEPLPADHVLWRTPRVVITSHTAAVSIPNEITGIFLDNYGRMSRGEPFRCRVDFERGY